MDRIILVAGLLAVGALGASPAFAQVQRTFVSGTGSDSNPCSRTAPCRTFGQAISATNPGGEVVVLDSAGYGPFSINKSVSIVAPPGIYSGMTVTSGVGVTINATASDTIILRGLTINCQGNFTGGINDQTGGTLHVENCTVNGFSSGHGLNFSGPGTLEVKDTTFRGGSSSVGIEVFASSGTAVATVERVRVEGCASGLVAEDGSKVTVRNSLASGNGAGFFAFGERAQVELTLERCEASNNDSGVAAENQGLAAVRVRVSNSIITNNTHGGLNNATSSSGVIFSRGNNTVEGNAIDIIGAIDSYTAR